MATVEAFNTGLTEEQLAEAFSRALSDYTDAQINVMLGGKQDTLTSAQLDAVNSGIDSEMVEQYDETVTLEAEDRAALAELVDSGAKNIIKPVSPTVPSGIAVTINADGTIRVTSDGTNAQAVMNIATQSTFEMVNGEKYVLSGCTGGSSTTYDLRLSLGGTNYIEYGEGVSFTYGGQATYGVAIVIRAAQTLDITFKPMICTKAAWEISQKYVPYRPSYDDLIARIEALESGTTRSVSTLATLSKSAAVDDSEDLADYDEDTTDTVEENDTAVEDEDEEVR